MKNLLVGVAVLALAGTAFGSINMAVTGPASVNLGDPIQITVSIAAKDTTITSFDAYLNAPGLAVQAPGAFGDHYGVGVANGWDGSGGIGVPVSGTGSDWVAGGPKVHIGNGTSGADCTPGAVFTVKFTAAAMGQYTIGLQNVSFGVDSDGTPYDGTVNAGALRVDVVPEPVSALLLLAGLPMLRRRR